MARNVYFAFHYHRDITRVNVIRKHDMTKDGIAEAGYYDESLWEKSKKEGDEGIRRMINGGLAGTTVTCVLVGAETASRPWVKYELKRTVEGGCGLLAVRIHGIKDLQGNVDTKGANPLDGLTVTVDGKPRLASLYYDIYDWIADDGYKNFGKWVEAAAKKPGK